MDNYESKISKAKRIEKIKMVSDDTHFPDIWKSKALCFVDNERFSRRLLRSLKCAQCPCSRSVTSSRNLP